MHCRYNITVVIVIFENNGRLEKAIENVLNQNTSGISIQLIVVSDLADAKTQAAVKKYQARNQERMKTVAAPLSDPVAARNLALPLVEGEYVHFLDPEDEMGRGVLNAVRDFFKKCGEETDLVFTPEKSGGSQKYAKPVARIFRSGTRVIDLSQERYDLPHMKSAFLRSEPVKREGFDEKLPLEYAERKMFLRLLAHHSKIGLLTGCEYILRDNGISRPDPEITETAWIDVLHHYYLSLASLSGVPARPAVAFIRRFLMKEIVRILKSNRNAAIFSPGNLEVARMLFCEILRKLDDATIISAKCPADHKLLALRMKYADKLIVAPGNRGMRISGPGSMCDLAVSYLPLSLDMLAINGDSVILDCSFPVFDDDDPDLNICAAAGETMFYGEKSGESSSSAASGLCKSKTADFKLEIPLVGRDVEVRFLIRCRGCLTPLKRVSLSQYFPLASCYHESYFISGGWRTKKDGASLVFHRCRRGTFLVSEYRFLLELWQKNRLGGRKAVLIRTLYHLLRHFCRKPVWLCSDRTERADDNGEAFFDYLRKNHPEIKAFFVINGKSVDFARMRRIGPVLKAESIRYKFGYLLARYAVSSHVTFFADAEYRKTAAYNDILHKIRRIFLQHGIIKDDMSPSLRRKRHYFSGFVTSAQREYESILHGAYGYTDKELWLTGLPRFDKLYCGTPRLITFMPTWRSYLMTKMKKRSNLRELKRLFLDSTYLKFYHAIFNDRRLIDAAKKFGYRLAVLPHPQMQNFIKAFDPDPSIIQLGLDRKLSYRDVYAGTALALTDYSSAVFDFCYLRKPVVYTQFDKEEFFANHTYVPGYFEYERDGFGEVEYDLDSAVARIIEYMSNGCVLKDRYRRRIDNFFTFNDRNNCQRIFEKIMSLEAPEHAKRTSPAASRDPA